MSSQSDPEIQKNTNDGATWWCKLLSKGAGIVAAIICGSCAIVNLVYILQPKCMAAGIIMFLISFVMILFEAPVCCMFFESTKPVTSWVNQRTYWQKGLLYLLISIIPVILCPGVASFIGCICPFAVGVIYGLMSLGRNDCLGLVPVPLCLLDSSYAVYLPICICLGLHMKYENASAKRSSWL